MRYEYKYYKEDGNIMRLYIKQEESSFNPRYDWDGYIGHMMCWHKWYRLGDYKENNYPYSDAFLDDLLQTNVKVSSIINFIRSNKTENSLCITYDRHKKAWILGQELPDGKLRVIEEIEDKEWLMEPLVDALTREDKWKLLEKYAKIVYLPLFLYDHSGITMNTCGFSDRWDSGQVGYIYTDKDTILNNVGGYYKGKRFIKCTDRNWKKAAYHSLQAEVETYDQYLRGEVYGIVTEKYNAETNKWDEADSCYGFFSKKSGDDLIQEIASDFGITAELYDDWRMAA